MKIEVGFNYIWAEIGTHLVRISKDGNEMFCDCIATYFNYKGLCKHKKKVLSELKNEVYKKRIN